MNRTMSFLATTVLAVLPSSVLAQPYEPPWPPEPPPPQPARLLWGFSLNGGAPTGYFGNVVGAGLGFSGHLLLMPSPGPFGLRCELSYLEYGSETFAVPIAGTSGRVDQEVTTSNAIGRFAVGPQLMARSGSIRPYVYATVGTSDFFTMSSLRTLNGDYDDYSTVDTLNYEAWTFSYGVGGGVQFAVARKVFLDLGVRYVASPGATWLAEGDLVDEGTGMAVPYPRHSPANLLEVTFGVSFGR
jgi:opacity protein-like surface antigen